MFVKAKRKSQKLSPSYKMAENYQVHAYPYPLHFLADIAPEMVQVKEQEPNVYDVVVMETRSRSAKVKYMLYWCQGYLKMNLPNCVVSL